MVNAAGIAGVSDFHGQGRKMDEASTNQDYSKGKWDMILLETIRKSGIWGKCWIYPYMGTIVWSTQHRMHNTLLITLRLRQYAVGEQSIQLIQCVARYDVADDRSVVIDVRKNYLPSPLYVR